MLTDFDGAGEILRAWGDGLRPDPDLTVSEWADRHRMLRARALGRARAVPHRAHALHARDHGRAVARRSGAADRVHEGGAGRRDRGGNNWIGFVIHQAPGPMLAVQPTVELAKRNSRQRIDPLIDESPELRERVKPARSRDAGNTMLSKEFAGRHPDHDRRELGGRAALDAGALHLPRRGRRLSGLGRRGRRSGHAGRGAVADLRPSAQGVPGLDADDPGAVAGSSGSTRRRDQRRLLRAVPALRRDAVAEVRAAALGEGAARDGGLSLRGLRRARSRSTTRPRCWRPANGGRPPTAADPATDRLSPLGALFAGRLAVLGADRPGMGGGAGLGRGEARLPQHDAGRDLGRDRRGAGLAAALRAPRALDSRHGARGRAVPDRRRRRAEGPDRGRCLGLGPRAGKLARRSHRDRGRARTGTTPGRS